MAISGGSGNDILHGGAGNDVLFGNAGNDKLYGHGGRDRLDGGSGNDLLDGGAGNDQMSGGGGNDVYIVDSKGDTVVEQANQGIDAVRASIALTAAFANVENYTFTGSGPVSFTGNALNNEIAGTGADDVLRGDAGNDVLIGGAGQDRLIGGSGNDTLVVSNLAFKQADGGSGTDTLSFTGAGSKIDLALDAGTSVTDIERIDLSQSGADDLTLSKLAVEKASSSTNQLIIDGNVGDVLHLDGAFALSGTKTVSGETYAFYKSGSDSVLVDQSIAVNPPEPVVEIKLADLDGTNGYAIDGGPAGAQFGARVSSLGDVNADGFDDFIVTNVSAYPPPTSPTSETAAYVVFGGAAAPGEPLDVNNLDGSNGYRLANPVDVLLYPAIGTGDFNSDGLKDILLTGNDHSYLVYGQAGPFTPIVDFQSLDGSNGFQVPFGDSAGYSKPNTLGDINGDGFDDIVIADYEQHKAIVLFGHAGPSDPVVAPTDDGTTGLTITGDFASDTTVSAAGDFNGDGIKDLAIGAASAEGTGAGYIVYGHSDGVPWIGDVSELDGSNGFKMTDVSQPIFGESVTSAGDVNGDHIDDIMITGFINDDAYIVFGQKGPTAPALDLRTLDGSNGFHIQNGGVFGFSVSAGDVNGDGYADLLIGCATAGTTQEGAAYVVYGKAGGFDPHLDVAALDGTTGFKISGITEFDHLGTDVSSAGDVNGDGYDDLLIAAPETDRNGVERVGTAYVVYGGDFRHEVDFQGTTGGDTKTGTAAAEIFVGRLGDDTLNGGGGADAFNGGAGNDQVHVADKNFRSVDGGTGVDILHFDYAGAINLGDIDGNAVTADRGKIAGVEVLDFDNGKSNAVSLHLADVLDLDVQNSDLGGVAGLDNVLKLVGNSGDSLTLFAADGWGAADTGSLAGYAVYSAGAVKIAVESDISVATA